MLLHKDDFIYKYINKKNITRNDVKDIVNWIETSDVYDQNYYVIFTKSTIANINWRITITPALIGKEKINQFDLDINIFQLNQLSQNLPQLENIDSLNIFPQLSGYNCEVFIQEKCGLAWSDVLLNKTLKKLSKKYTEQEMIEKYLACFMDENMRWEELNKNMVFKKTTKEEFLLYFNSNYSEIENKIKEMKLITDIIDFILKKII